MNTQFAVVSRSGYIAMILATLMPHPGAANADLSGPAWGPFRDERSSVLNEAHVHEEFRPALTDGAIVPPADVEQTSWNVPAPGDHCVIADPPVQFVADPAVLYAASSWQWQVLPSGLIWQSYWAGVHEPRFSGATFGEKDGPWLLDVTLGGRASLLRYGAQGPSRLEGWEMQIEGAGIPRLNLDENWDVEATDFRFGVPIIYGRDNLQWKFSYYHLSSHLGDELAIREDRLDERINFSRDALVLGISYYPLPAWRWYAEAGWAFYYDEGSEPWEFQFGVDVAEPGPTGIEGTPFLAINGHLREEHNFGGNVVLQAGWLWRGRDQQTLRLGFHYYNGKSSQFEFFDQFEEQIGLGIWYDF